jgi:hypothetical protein
MSFELFWRSVKNDSMSFYAANVYVWTAYLLSQVSNDSSTYSTVFENCVLGAGPITGNLSRFILSKTKNLWKKKLLQDLKALYVNWIVHLTFLLGSNVMLFFSKK